MSKPCGRCGAGDSEYGDQPAYCAEVEVAFGLLAWLCFDCRKEYHRFAKSHPLNKEYGEALLRFEFWRDHLPETTPRDIAIEEGIALWNKVDDIQLKVNEVANQWMISDPDELR
ncbi:MAG: hypothetical protein ACXADH_00030 [Candidatus Kariarchaeaceae archaeon]|jgi:hypothetical protein